MTTRKILVIDDSPDDQLLYRRALNKCAPPYTTVETDNGNEALELIETEKPACVLLDYSLPGDNGIAILKRIRQSKPFLPVIILTGYGNETVAVEAMREGAQNYISKSGITAESLDHLIQLAIALQYEREQADKDRQQLRHSQKMEALGQLTGGISHDFNNLLAVILGNLDFMVEQLPANDPLLDLIKPCISAAEHGSELTRQLLAFGRKQALQPNTVSVNELLEQFSLLVRHTLGERIEIIVAPADDTWNIHVDPSQLQNALLNLAVNARDAMKEGGKLIIETKNIHFEEGMDVDREITSGDYVMLSVSDTGAGMLPEIIEKAFEPFFTTKEAGKGTGLGLSMVYGFVKQSAGHIKIYSEPGQGTSVKLFLPKDKEGVSAADDAAAEPLHEPTGQTVLVVEDNLDLLKLTSRMVASMGYNVLSAETAESALEQLKAYPGIRMLLTDVMLPGAMNGPALAKQALVLNSRIKVLFNSGYAEQAMQHSGLLEKGVNIISKPFRARELALKIEEVMKS